jgi:hypothetical protein
VEDQFAELLPAAGDAADAHAVDEDWHGCAGVAVADAYAA